MDAAQKAMALADEETTESLQFAQRVMAEYEAAVAAYKKRLPSVILPGQPPRQRKNMLPFVPNLNARSQNRRLTCQRPNKLEVAQAK
ncbi:MAG: hypothetical protein IPK63_18605 [Candidatus Competibacteraceae bacterium]|nr:hypothetical protein [Candidatus Competibacteraceae bacterium]